MKLSTWQLLTPDKATRRRRVLWAAGALLLVPVWAVHAQVPVQSTQNVLSGSRVFGAKGCAKCHAVKNLGGGVGPDLGTTPAPQSFEGFAAAIWNHMPEMVKEMRALGIEQPRLSPWEAGDLIAFLFWVDYFDAPGDAEAGKGVFSAKQCDICHQVGGLGGVYGPNLDFLTQYGSPIQIATAMWNHGPRMTDAMRARGLSRPTFTGSELSNLIAFLESATPGLPSEPMYILPGRSESGRRYFEERGCVICHSVGGQGGRIGPPLGGRGGRQNLIEFAAAMWNKAPSMIRALETRGMSVPELRPNEMADLVGYLYSVEYFGASGSASRGRRYLTTKGCLECHSLRGRGGSTAGDLAAVRGLESRDGIIAALWNHALVDQRAADVSWPTFTAAEMASLATFLQTLGPNP